MIIKIKSSDNKTLLMEEHVSLVRVSMEDDCISYYPGRNNVESRFSLAENKDTQSISVYSDSACLLEHVELNK